MNKIAKNWRSADLLEQNRALCAYAEKLTLEPKNMCENDIFSLRQNGFNDQSIHDAVQVISYFNYINRIADALDVELEDFIQEWEK